MNYMKTKDETYIAAKAILEGQINEATSVFVVSGITDYEGSEALGVYTNKSAAQKALDAYMARVAQDKKNRTYNDRDYDDYNIEVKPFNSPI